jgi:serine/threonine protein kinase
MKAPLGSTHATKRKSVDHEVRPPKGSRSNSQRSNQALEDTQATSLYAPNDGSFEIRLFCCLAISPAGGAISKFESIPQLLTALHDAIKAHRSLYLEGKILHRDISENNIIITDPKKADGFTGTLIDADLAKEVGGGRTGARHQTGTMQFMAIQVLRQIAHTYRHDLESFFYVLLWISARRAWEREFGCRLVDQPKESMLRQWYTGSYKEIAQSKEYAMTVNGFEALLEEFPLEFDCVKPICREIRDTLFPYRNGNWLFTGTTEDPPEKLYNTIIDAFDRAIAGMPTGHRAPDAK